MTLSDRLAAALARLSASVEHLESAAERRADLDAGRADLEQEFALVQDDRSRLALDLDAALAHGRSLTAAQAQVSARLERASATVQAVLVQFEPSERDDEPADSEAATALPVSGAGE